MIRSLLPIARRCLPKITKVIAFSFTYYNMQKISQFSSPIQCFHISFHPTNKMGEVLKNVIRVQHNGEFVGYAFCFMENYFVSTSPELIESKNTNKKFDFYIGETKIQTNVRVIQNFENLAFIQAKNTQIKPIDSYPVELYTSVQIAQKRTYLSIKSGYYVAKDGGFGIIDGKGEVGSLVLNDDGAVGVVTQVGRDHDRGFLRMICWSDLKHVLHRLKQEPLYLGISARAMEERDGISVVRVAGNSPLQRYVQMGDIITRVNNVPVKNPDDLHRMIMTSGPRVILNIENQNKIRRQVEVMI